MQPKIRQEAPDMGTRISSSEIRKLVAIELYRNRNSLPEIIQAYFVGVGKDVASAIDHVASLIDITVQLDRVEYHASASLTKQYEEAAMLYLIARFATFPLLKQLQPAITRTDVARLREQLGAQQPPARPPIIPTDELPDVFKAWEETRDPEESELTHWYCFAHDKRITKWPVTSLYQVIVIDAQEKA
jgi:hypothetical protein